MIARTFWEKRSLERIQGTKYQWPINPCLFECSNSFSQSRSSNWCIFSKLITKLVLWVKSVGIYDKGTYRCCSQNRCHNILRKIRSLLISQVLPHLRGLFVSLSAFAFLFIRYTQNENIRITCCWVCAISLLLCFVKKKERFLSEPFTFVFLILGLF